MLMYWKNTEKKKKKDFIVPSTYTACLYLLFYFQELFFLIVTITEKHQDCHETDCHKSILNRFSSWFQKFVLEL